MGKFIQTYEQFITEKKTRKVKKGDVLRRNNLEAEVASNALPHMNVLWKTHGFDENGAPIENPLQVNNQQSLQ